ncbi:hypothetical protein IAU60_002693 [Kwoniella sp. DSM 27419]
MPLRCLRLPGKPFELAFRLSTPSRRVGADKIEPDYPTILFTHPLLVDSFFFYPQYEEPQLYGRYNLLAFDSPAHGGTRMSAVWPGEYTMEVHAQILLEALHALEITSIHVVGASMSTVAAMHLASMAPDLVITMTLMAPVPTDEPEPWKVTFRECQTGYDIALHGDYDLLDSLVLSGLDYNTNAAHDPAIKEVVETYCQQYRSKLTDGLLKPEHAIPTMTALLKSRTAYPDEAGLDRIVCPVQILQGTGEGWAEEDYIWAKGLVDRLNANSASRGGPQVANAQVLEGTARWSSLGSPDVINPLLLQFIASGKIAGSQSSESTRGRPRLLPPISPLEQTSFEIPALTRRPSVRSKTIGDIMGELEAQGAEARGVNVEVEVTVKVDEEYSSGHPMAIPS